MKKIDIKKSREKDTEFIAVLQSNVPIVNSKTAKADEIVLNNLRTSENTTPTNGTAEEDAFAHHKKATENMVAQWTEEEEQVISHTADNHSPHEKDVKWFYQDPQGDIQGPFASAEMLEWFSAGYFTVNLKVRRSCDDTYSELGDLIKTWGRVPFMPGSHPPPIRVDDYVKSYLGEGKEPREFAKQFLEKRSKFRNQAKQAPAEDNTLWGPAPAITPSVNKPVVPSNECDGNSNAKGKTKRRKNRMQKLDNSMLGFTVQSNPDRLNVGEIDHIDGM